MKSEQVVTDSATKALRPMEYQDVAILLRSPGSFGEQLAQILIDYGIPAQVASSSGYFSTIEVQTILNMLRLIDNPRQDIPLAAVLKSYIGGVSGEELAKIRIAALEQPFYKAVMDYADQGEDKALAVKLAQFFTVLNGYRDKVCDTPIHELLFQVMDETGYLDYVYALPGGKIRRANLEMLLEKAIAYESTSYRGLFHFIRYMNQLETYQVDYGEASEDSKENAVQIYSIHKSKGLEFPIVFVAGMGRQFNQQDSRSMLVLHPQLGIGLDVTDTIRRTRTPALTRQILARQIKLENAGEELRVLYVALTRAREKLVISGTLKKAEKKLAAGMELSGEQHGKLGFLKRLQASCYFDWILPALKRKPKDYPITLIDPGYLAVLKLTQQLEQEMDLLQLKQQLAQTDPSWQQKIAERLSFQYAYCGEENNKTKMTVSEMKHRALDQLQQVEESGELLYEEKPMNPYVPDFMQDTHDETIAVRRGTAMHRVLECLDFSLCQNTLKEQIAQLVQQRKLDETMAAFVSVPALEQFFRSELAQRMKAAATVGLFYREQPFIMGKPSCEVLPGTKSSELILIQGIIDAFFEEHGELVLVEYKTDRVKQAQELVQRYHIQMDLYQEALERAWGKKVKERYLYSFCLQKEIRYEKG
jgi:ATP-dependent helicase/nuclease subunit A